MRRSRFCASLLERRQCELARSPSTSLRSMRVFPFTTIGRRARSDVVGLPLARTIGNIKGTIGNMKGRSLAAVDGSGLMDPTLALCDSAHWRAAQSHAADYGSTKTYVNRQRAFNARRQRATTRDTRRAGHTRVRAVISRWHRRPEGRPPSEGRQAGRDGAALARAARHFRLALIWA